MAIPLGAADLRPQDVFSEAVRLFFDARPVESAREFDQLVAAVLEAAEKGEGETRRNQRCYAHLYLGLFHEAAGNAKQAREHITQAAGPLRMNHYMGKVAVMHAKLRGWPAHELPDAQPR